MIINNKPANEAVMSNVGEIGEFKIRNSAKAFSILSSGLYANKVRAIVRELSCNAVDSHVAAKNSDTPFDVHLPNQLEPWFAIRDYGTGLTHEQVTQIYTTYFESTKTDSNDFIGALGLGSKSPFSYTDNFTVTAIRDGHKGIYSAFINANGVPSIAKMMEEDTDEPSGVEVKFSVNEYYDYNKFRDEARHVYTYFKLRPVVSGAQGFEFTDVKYETMNIIPGVHSTSNRSYNSVAVMGNISYPIDIPRADSSLDNLRGLLDCGLEMHFSIGELDFQASREGLSYIPQTVASIKAKLEAVNAQLAVHVATEADALPNSWERALFLERKRVNGLWSNAVEKYIVDNQFNMYTIRPGYTSRLSDVKVKVNDLAKRFNITLRGFRKNRGTVGTNNFSPYSVYDNDVVDAEGHVKTWMEWQIPVSKDMTFIVNDTKVGATERAKSHYRNASTADTPHSRTVLVLEPVDKAIAMNTKAFFRILRNPPVSMIHMASGLTERTRAASSGGTGKNVSIMKLQRRGSGGYDSQREMVWRDAGKVDSFPSTETHYYVPLNGFALSSERLKGVNPKELLGSLQDCGFDDLKFRVLGVRKSDINFIKTQPNWINAEDRILEVLTNATAAQIKSIAMGTIDRSSLVQYNADIVKSITNAKSPYVLAAMAVKNSTRVEASDHSLKSLCSLFGVVIDIETAKGTIAGDSVMVFNRYPLLSNLIYLGYRAESAHIAEYINLVDAAKGV